MVGALYYFITTALNSFRGYRVSSENGLQWGLRNYNVVFLLRVVFCLCYCGGFGNLASAK